jgi:hypothetical protein
MVEGTPPWDWHRVGALLVAGSWILLRLIMGTLHGLKTLSWQAPKGALGAVAGVLVSATVVVPVAAIWFADDLADGVQSTLIRVFGWIALIALTYGSLGIFFLLAPG